MMTQMKERAVELIERIPDEKMFYVINILQNLEEMSSNSLQIRNRQWKHSRMC